MNVVIYLRVSTRRQFESGNSIAEQRRAIEIYCRAKGYNIVAIYIEEGRSARSERRSVFQTMTLDLVSGKVKAQAVILHNRARFFRDVYGAKKYERMLERKDIEIISLDVPTEGMPPSTKHFTVNMVDAASQYHSEFTGFLTLAGMLGNARQGYYNGGRPPYGYKSVKAVNDMGRLKSKLVISPSEKEIVLRIFSLYMRGNGGGKIAKQLNHEKLYRRNGKEWEKSNILDIISNPIYKGEYTYNRRVSRTKKPNPESEWVRIEVEATVDEETFNLTQRIRKQNAPQVTNPAVVSSPTLLTGLLKHGHCGSSMTLETGKSGQYRYYNCRKFLRSKSCRGQRVSTEILDKEVLEHITNKLFSPKRLRLLLQEFARDMKKKKNNQNTDETAIRSEIRENERELENVYMAIRQGIVKQGNIDEVIEKLKDEIESLEIRLNKVQREVRFRLPPHVFSPKFLERFQLRLEQILSSDVPLAKSYLKLFLSTIKLKGRNVTLVAKKDILLNALVRNDQPHLAGVPTAGTVWLPGQDSNLQPSG